MTKIKAILMADAHLRATQPVARTDDYVAAQLDKWEQISDLQKKLNCPVIDAGDMFDNPKNVSFSFFNKVVDRIPHHFYTIPGNHDMSYHTKLTLPDTPWWTLKEFGVIRSLDEEEPENLYSEWGIDFVGIPYGKYGETKIPKPRDRKAPRVLVLHELVWKREPPFPDAEGFRAIKLLNAHPEFDLIVTGHNHKTCTARKGKRWLVNPGSIMRSRTDQIKHKPCVFLWTWDVESGSSVEPMYLNVAPAEEVISDKHISQSKKAEDLLETFLLKVKNQDDLSLDFKENLVEFMNREGTDKEVQKIVLESV